MAGNYRWRVLKTYTPFFEYMKRKHGVNILYELLYGLPILPPNETVEVELP